MTDITIAVAEFDAVPNQNDNCVQGAVARVRERTSARMLRKFRPWVEAASKTGAAAGLALALISGPTLAEMTDVPLFERGVWDVRFVYDETGERDLAWCEAGTATVTGQTFSINTSNAGAFGMVFFDPGWSLTERNVSVRVDVDYEKFNGMGEANGQFLFVPLGDNDTGFLRQIMTGSAIALFNEAGDRLATFSLAGSAASLQNLIACEERLPAKASGADPFGRPVKMSDPFGGRP